MDTTATYRFMAPDEADVVCGLIVRVYNEFEAPAESPEGVREFLSYVQPDFMRKRLSRDHFVLVAVVDEAIVGAIETRNNNHISLLFVDRAFHRRGLARGLFKSALDICRSNIVDLKTITVNSSPYAIEVYQRLDFFPIGEKQTIHGITFIPMAFKVR